MVESEWRQLSQWTHEGKGESICEYPATYVYVIRQKCVSILQSGLFSTNKGGTADINICPFKRIGVFCLYANKLKGNEYENETMV